jgi:hypothetical protein
VGPRAAHVARARFVLVDDRPSGGYARRVVPGDTDRAAHEAQLRAYRRMGPEARVALCAHMSEDARRIALSGIRSRHPDYDDERARRALFSLVLGEDVVRAVWPREALIAP